MGAPATIPSPTMSSLLSRIAATERPDLVVVIGYGDELPVFRHARALWQFYAAHFPAIDLVFVRWSDQLKPGEVHHNGYDLLVGIGDRMQGATGYASSGVWSGSENAKWIYRQMLVQDYLLRTRSAPFYFYHTTLTSVVDFRALSTVLDQLPKTGCYAGPIARLNGPPEMAGLTFTSGASTILSHDALQHMRAHYDPQHPWAQFPNDIWAALMLPHFMRTPLPTFNFVRPRAPMADAAELGAIARHLLQQGHFHFRVKTVEPQDAAGRRQDVDPWIMLRLMETVLSSEHEPERTRALMAQYAQEASGGEQVPARRGQSLFSGARTLPLSDSELFAT